MPMTIRKATQSAQSTSVLVEELVAFAEQRAVFGVLSRRKPRAGFDCTC